jgi:hypothetical protein
MPILALITPKKVLKTTLEMLFQEHCIPILAYQLLMLYRCMPTLTLIKNVL